MIFTFKKCWRNLKRTVSVVLCLVLLSVLFVVPASAAESLTGQFIYVNFLDSQRADISVAMPLNNGTGSYPLKSGAVSPGDHVVSLYNARVMPNKVISGAVGVYYSFYYVFPGATSLVETVSPSSLSPSISYRTTSENVDFTFYDVGSYKSFGAPVIDGSMTSRGWVYKGRTPYFESINPVSYLFFEARNGSGAKVDPTFSYTSSSSSAPHLYIPSATVIVSDVVTLDWMEGLADSLTGDSDILTSMYADVMSILNDMYSVMQNQLAVERAIKGYFEELLPLIESIDSSTANIYSLLQTQFQLLRTLIATESGNIQDAIEQQTQDLITYFDTVFSESIGDMPEKSDDLDTSVGNFSDAESQYQSTATQRFDELASSFNGFSGGTLSGITLASTLFTRVWDALGDYSIVYTFPLLLGLSLVLVGRLGRGSGGQSSAEKHRGDSSA